MRIIIKYSDYDGQDKLDTIWAEYIYEIQILNTDPMGSELGENSDN